jgi:hypothetical protein
MPGSIGGGAASSGSGLGGKRKSDGFWPTRTGDRMLELRSHQMNIRRLR